jgi:hypothetical protein
METLMPDRLDDELHAVDADRWAETAHSMPMAHGWRDIAAGYRVLADFFADAQLSQRWRQEKREED